MLTTGPKTPKKHGSLNFSAIHKKPSLGWVFCGVCRVHVARFRVERRLFVYCMNKIELFSFQEKIVRVLGTPENPLFVAADVCQILEIGNSSDSLKGLDEDEKITLANSEGNPRAGVPHQLNCVTESGLYSLVFKSRKPEAKKFRKWVTSEVLPALRKQGLYEIEEGEKNPSEALTALEGIAFDASRARAGLIAGEIPVETAQVISSLCAQGLRAWEMRLRIKPEILTAQLSLLSIPGDEMHRVLVAVADSIEGNGVFTMSDLFVIAREAGVLKGDLTEGRAKSFGKGLVHCRMHVYTDSRGRKFRMDKRRCKDGTRYSIQFNGEVAK